MLQSVLDLDIAYEINGNRRALKHYESMYLMNLLIPVAKCIVSIMQLPVSDRTAAINIYVSFIVKLFT